MKAAEAARAGANSEQAAKIQREKEA